LDVAPRTIVYFLSSPSYINLVDGGNSQILPFGELQEFPSPINQ